MFLEGKGVCVNCYAAWPPVIKNIGHKSVTSNLQLWRKPGLCKHTQALLSLLQPDDDKLLIRCTGTKRRGLEGKGSTSAPSLLSETDVQPLGSP